MTLSARGGGLLRYAETNLGRGKGTGPEDAHTSSSKNRIGG